MEFTETCVAGDGEDNARVLIPRGGPIYVPNMIGPLTRVSDFESLVYNELEDLKKEICWDSTEICDEDIAVDELKVLTEEELVDKAFEVAFKVGKATEESSQLVEENARKGKTDDDKISSNKEACENEAGPSNACENGAGASNACENGAGASNVCENGAGASNACENEAGASKACENVAGASNACENEAGASNACENEAGASNACENEAGASNACEIEAGASNACENEAGASNACESEAGASNACENEAGASNACESEAGASNACENEAGASNACENEAGPSNACENEAGPSNASENEAEPSNDENGNSKKKAPIKRKRKRKRPACIKKDALDESYMENVKELARIKQKQDEDKAAARLHSFNGGAKINERASDKAERLISLKSTSSAIKTWSSNAREHVPLLYPETILCFEVYESRRTRFKTQEFLVLGRQYLTELRDKIYCMTDGIMKKADQHDPSGYFLIEDVFCNDMREPSAIDYSKPICDWLRNSKKEASKKWEYIISGELQQKKKSLFGSETETNLPRFRAVEMHKTRFCDLRFRLGAGYLYCHQGDCKHVIVIRDMRLVNPEDVQNRACYPLMTFQAKIRFQKCSVCKIYKAEKVTVDDKWAPESPCYFCGVCYYMLHYVNKSLLYDEFSVYDYHHE